MLSRLDYASVLRKIITVLMEFWENCKVKSRVRCLTQSFELLVSLRVTFSRYFARTMFQLQR